MVGGSGGARGTRFESGGAAISTAVTVERWKEKEKNRCTYAKNLLLCEVIKCKSRAKQADRVKLET